MPTTHDWWDRTGQYTYEVQGKRSKLAICLLSFTFVLVGQCTEGIVIEYSTTIGSGAPTGGILGRYSLWHSAAKLWEAKLWMASLLIFSWSGVWPYIKLVFVTFLVLLPMRFEAHSRLKSMLSALSKWSMIDVWITAVVAQITTSRISLVAVVVTVTGTLLKGTGIFLASQLLAGPLLVSVTTRKLDAEFLKQLGRYTVARPVDKMRRQRGYLVEVAIFGYALCTAILFPLLVLPAFSVSYAIGETPAEAVTAHSVVGMLWAMSTDAAKEPGWNIVVGLVGIVTACILPLVQALALLSCLVMQRKADQVAIILNQLGYLSTLCYLDVFLLGTVVLKLQLSQARWDLFASVSLPIASSLNVSMALEPVFYVLAVVVALEAVLRVVLTRMCLRCNAEAEHDATERADDHDDTSAYSGLLPDAAEDVV